MMSNQRLTARQKIIRICFTMRHNLYGDFNGLIERRQMLC